MSAPLLASAARHQSSSSPALRSARAPCFRHSKDSSLGTSFLCAYHWSTITILQSYGPLRLFPSCCAFGEVHTAGLQICFIFLNTTITIRLFSSPTAGLQEILL
jgi:hypothetical protein